MACEHDTCCCHHDEDDRDDREEAVEDPVAEPHVCCGVARSIDNLSAV